MSILKDAIEKIASMAENKVYEIKGESYSDNKLHLVEEVVHRPSSLSFSTLGAIVDMVKTEIDRQRTAPLFVHVESSTAVKVYTSYDEKYRRDSLYVANAVLPNIGIIGRFIPHENAIIVLRSLFELNSDIDYMLDLLSKISKDSNVTTNDNGVTQRIEAKSGISLLENVVPKPRVALKPFRTFLEVDQPESDFLLRVKEGGEIGLFEADGGMWELEARRNIKAHLEQQLSKLMNDRKVMVTA